MDVSLSFIIGIIGNVISLLVFGSPIGTFRRILIKKKTENYKSLPYISTLLSTSLWTFYGILKPGGLLVLTVNGAGAVLQFIFVTLFLVFAPKDKKIKTMIGVAIYVVFVGVVVAVTMLAMHGSLRITFVGVICAVLTIGMYASPLSAMTTVIEMKSVEYMPFFLSLFLFLNAGVWSLYSVLVMDYYIGVPNGIGFVLGSAQLILYTIYRNKPLDKVTIAPAEEGLAQVLIGPIMEKTIPEGEAQPMRKRLPNPKRSLTRQLSTLPVLLKTLSLGPYDINYSFSRDKDVNTNANVDK